jgi:hypothetical protein
MENSLGGDPLVPLATRAAPEQSTHVTGALKEDYMLGFTSITAAVIAGILGLSPPNRAGSAVGPATDLPPGTTIPVTLDQDIPIKEDQFGQTFPAHVTRDVVVNGKVTVPEGSPAKVKLVPSSEKSDNVTLRLAEVRTNEGTQTVNSSDARPDTERSHKGLGKKTGIGAAAGAVVGAITGAGIVKGAVVGAGGGLAWGLLGGQKQIGRDTQLEFSTK